MVREFGLNENGNIKTHIKFIPDMRRFCGQVVTIARVHRNKYYLIEEDTGKFKFTDEMIDGYAFIYGIE